ncbi:hypothetical protein [Niabella ginsengisoli]|nr:hypothetical protein [Niabella ginsengisoli]
MDSPVADARHANTGYSGDFDACYGGWESKVSPTRFLNGMGMV